MHRRAIVWGLLGAVWAWAGAALAADPSPPVDVGVAAVDITPTGPIRLCGYGDRKTESEGVDQHLWAKALAIGADDAPGGPAVLITVDNIGVPDRLVARVAAALHESHGLARERLAVCSTHTHTGPMLDGTIELMFAPPLPAEERAHIAAYTAELVDKLVEVARAALADRRPGRLAWSQGEVGFAANRRTLKNGRWAGFGVNRPGPVDHALPALRVTDADGKLRALLTSYACHCTTLTGKHNRIAGDWAGHAQELFARRHPGGVLLVAIGCGADQNPEPRGEPVYAVQHAEALVDELDRLLEGPWRELPGTVATRLERIPLAFDTPPTREEFEQRIREQPGRPAAYHARVQLDRLDRGEPLQTSLDYVVQSWAFGDQLAMVFLAGEVVVDYARRLKKEFDAERLWVNAYANDVPCYIASRRVLGEGGYEVDSSMYYYDRPTHFRPEIEDQIVAAVGRLVPEAYRAPPHAFAADIRRFEEADRARPPAPGGVLFVGSSTIRRWDTEGSFPGLGVLNRGFGGSTYADVLYYVERVIWPYRPQTLLLYAGDNDLARGATPAQVTETLSALLREVRGVLPETRVLVVSIKPSPKRAALMDTQRDANRRIRGHLAGLNDPRIEFVDLFDAMLGPDGQPRAELFVEDRLHLSPAGYALWTEIIGPRLAPPQ